MRKKYNLHGPCDRCGSFLEERMGEGDPEYFLCTNVERCTKRRARRTDSVRLFIDNRANAKIAERTRAKAKPADSN